MQSTARSIRHPYIISKGKFRLMNPEIEKQIRACEARLYLAMFASDVAELDALLADDLLFAGPTGELATKATDPELHRTGATQFQEFAGDYRYTRIWRNGQAGWQIVGRNVTAMGQAGLQDRARGTPHVFLLF